MKFSFLFTILLLTSTQLAAQEQTFVKEYTYKASEMDSKFSCRAIAINQLRSTLLNEIGVYVQSEQLLTTKDVNGKFYQNFVENIATISAGVTKLEILDEKWNGEIFWMKASITIDKENLQESLRQIIHDRHKLQELSETKRELIEATKEIDRLRKELTLGVKKNDSISQRLNLQKYDSGIKILNAIDYLLAGKNKLLQKDFIGTIEDLTKAIELNPKYTLAYGIRGAAKINLHDYRGAVNDYARATELDPLIAYNFYFLGASKMGIMDIKGAITDFTTAIELDSQFADAFKGRGTAKIMIVDLRGAIEDFTRAIQINPKDGKAYSYRGSTKRDIKDYIGAIEDLTKAIQINPKDGFAYHLRGLSKFNLNENDNGCSDLKSALELGNEDAYGDFKKYCH